MIDRHIDLSAPSDRNRIEARSLPAHHWRIRLQLLSITAYASFAALPAFSAELPDAAASSAYSQVQQPESLKDAATPDPYRLRMPRAEDFRLRSSKTTTRDPQAPIGGLPPPALAERPFNAYVIKAAKDYGVDPALVHAVITVESGYNVRAVSPKGAQGLMQLLPDTAQRFGISAPGLVWKPERNIRAGVAYLSALLELFNQDLTLALAAYNAGENAVMRFGRIPPFRETQEYVPKVLEVYGQLRPARPVPLPVAGSPTARIHYQYPAPRSETLNGDLVSD